MLIDWSFESIGLQPKVRNELARLKEKGYLRLGPREQQKADDNLELAKVAFKTYFVKRLFTDYPVKIHLSEAIGVVDSNLSAVQKTPRRISASTIGRVSLYDSRYAGAISSYRQIEDYFWMRLPAEPVIEGAVSSAALTDKMVAAQQAIDELWKMVRADRAGGDA